MPRFKELLGIAAFLLGCAQAPTSEVPATNKFQELGPLPATYVSNPSCAGCLAVTLTLRPDGSYLVRELVGSSEFYDFGRWLASREGVLELVGGRDAPRRYALRGQDLDSQAGTQGGDLKRAHEVEPLRGPFRLIGLYDGTTFKECRTGLAWRLADSRAAEALKLEFVMQQSKSVLVALDARFESRTEAETLLVQRPATLLNERACPG